MDEVARLRPRDRADLFLVAADKRGLAPQIIEKDFWVCWTLRRVFDLPDPPAAILFKGGTSLSKAFGLIDRFSEDIDLVLDRDGLGFKNDRDPAQAPSRKQRQRLIDELRAASSAAVRERLLPALEASFRDALDSSPVANGWLLEIAEDDMEAQTLLFQYPPGLASNGLDASRYIQPSVRLEFGARGEHWPATEAIIQPYAAEALPKQFASPLTTVPALAPERTFWEKATLLHMLHHKPGGDPFGGRQSRHYYDLAALAESEAGAEAMRNLDLLAAVVRHKDQFFAAAWAHYADAARGKLRLVPAAERLQELKKDYQQMREMIFGDPPPFDRLIESLQELEARINRSFG